MKNGKFKINSFLFFHISFPGAPLRFVPPLRGPPAHHAAGGETPLRRY